MLTSQKPCTMFQVNVLLLLGSVLFLPSSAGQQQNLTSTCDFAAKSAACNLADFNLTQYALPSRDMRYVKFTNLNSASALTYTGWEYQLTMLNPSASGQTPQTMAWAFGFAPNVATASGCLAAVAAGGNCDTLSTWGVVSYYKNDIVNTGFTIRGNSSYSPAATLISAKTNATANTEVIAFIGSLSSTDTISVTFKLWGVDPGFGTPNAAAIPSSSIFTLLMALAAVLLLTRAL